MAYALQENLRADAEVTVWPQGVFEPSSTGLRSLMQVLDTSDFGVFVFTPDDSVRLRKRTQSVVRDNVVFEFGLFMGKLGSDRTFVVVPSGVTDLRLPTDLTGITLGEYDPKRSDKNLQTALGPFCNQLRRVLKKRGALRRHPAVPRSRRRGMYTQGVTIHSALYGVNDSWLDVTVPVRNALDSYGVARASNDLAGDPQRGFLKTLRLDFSLRGERRQVAIPEGGLLMFPSDAT